MKKREMYVCWLWLGSVHICRLLKGVDPRGIYVLESHNLLNTDADFANTPYFTF